MKTRFVLLVALISLAVSALADPPVVETAAGSLHSFKVTLVSQMTLEIEGKARKMTGNTELRYNWQRKGRERTLSVDSVLIKADYDGAEMMNAFMSREKFTGVQQGKRTEIALESAPDPLKKMLQDSFGAPLCIVQVDEQGREVKRDVVAGTHARNIIENGTIANALLFHPPFLTEGNDWSTDSEVSMGNGSYAKGKLGYKKLAAAQSLQKCKVSGMLVNESARQPGSSVTIRNTRYVINGEQVFNLAVKEWDSGTLTMNVTNQMVADGKIVGSAQGVMSARFERLATK